MKTSSGYKFLSYLQENVQQINLFIYRVFLSPINTKILKELILRQIF